MNSIVDFVKKRLFAVGVVLLCIALVVNVILLLMPSSDTLRASAQGSTGDDVQQTKEDDYIKWVDFTVTSAAMERALKLDIESHDGDSPLNWIELLAYLGAKYGGNFKRYKAKDMDALVQKLSSGVAMQELTADMKYYDYYYEAYDAVLGGLAGTYQIQTADSLENGTVVYEEKYGLKAYSPIAYGYCYSHYDDFGNSRSFGFRRTHLGNDLLGSIGTPIVAVESGVVETVGWNRYGGWRVGIRSLDGKRYYYYAHMRKNRPYHADLKEGAVIEAGDIIGYLGMTGYSDTENVNGMSVPHLHFGMQLIFDESQKEGNNEIWIDVYHIIDVLEHHKSPVVRDDETKEYYRKYDFVDSAVEALDGSIPQFSKNEEEANAALW